MILYDKDEIQEWEDMLLQKATKRAFKTKKEYKCPRRKKLNEYRNHRGTKYWYKGECKYVRQQSNRCFRRKFKAGYSYELTPVPHDYKTYGWITW